MNKGEMIDRAFALLTQAEADRDALAAAWDKFVITHDRYLAALSIDGARKALSQAAYTNELNQTYSDMREARETVEVVRARFHIPTTTQRANADESEVGA